MVGKEDLLERDRAQLRGVQHRARPRAGGRRRAAGDASGEARLLLDQRGLVPRGARRACCGSTWPPHVARAAATRGRARARCARACATRWRTARSAICCCCSASPPGSASSTWCCCRSTRATSCTPAPQAYGLLVSAFGVGSLVSAVLMTRQLDRWALRRNLLIGLGSGRRRDGRVRVVARRCRSRWRWDSSPGSGSSSTSRAPTRCSSSPPRTASAAAS